MSNETEYTNYNQPSKQIALDLIYIYTGYDVPLNKIEFGLPEAVDPIPEKLTDENTYTPAEISPFEDGRFITEDNGFLYRRLNLNEIQPNTGITLLNVTYPFYVHDVLPAINSFLGTQLDQSDLVNDYYEDASKPVIVRAHKHSLAWIGERMLNAGTGRFLVPVTILPGFREYRHGIDPLGDMKPYKGNSLGRLVDLINTVAIRQLTYGVDFTLSNMTAVSGSSEYNTKMRLTPTDPTYSPQDLYYTRLDIGILANLPAGFLEAVKIYNVPFSIHGILAEINTALDLNLTTDETYNTTYSTRENRYNLQVRGNASWAWITSTYSFLVEHQLTARLLEDGTLRLLEDGTTRTLETL